MSSLGGHHFVGFVMRLISFMDLSKDPKKNIAVFSEKTDVPHLPNQSMVAI